MGVGPKGTLENKYSNNCLDFFGDNTMKAPESASPSYARRDERALPTFHNHVEETVNSLRFNQDHSLFLVGTDTGIRMWTTDTVTETERLDDTLVGKVAFAEVLLKFNRILYVQKGFEPGVPDNIASVYVGQHPKYNKEGLNWAITCKSPILGVRFAYNKESKIHATAQSGTEYMMFIMETEIQATCFGVNSCLYLSSFKTARNPNGLCEINYACTKKRQIMVFPHPRKGYVQVVNLMDLRPDDPTNIHSVRRNTFGAHRNDLACLALNAEGTLLATASMKGTLIRIWDLANGNAQILELRRGTDEASMHCLNFSPDSKYLCCSSDKGTVHIFAIKDATLNTRSPLGSFFMGTYADSKWSLIKITPPDKPEIHNKRCICAFGEEGILYVVNEGGIHYKYSLNIEGKSAKLLSQCNYLYVVSEDM